MAAANRGRVRRDSPSRYWSSGSEAGSQAHNDAAAPCSRASDDGQVGEMGYRLLRSAPGERGRWAAHAPAHAPRRESSPLRYCTATKSARCSARLRDDRGRRPRILRLFPRANVQLDPVMVHHVPAVRLGDTKTAHLAQKAQTFGKGLVIETAAPRVVPGPLNPAIGELAPAADASADNACFTALTVAVQGHDEDQRPPGLPLIERDETLGESSRQHRKREPRQVVARARDQGPRQRARNRCGRKTKHPPGRRRR